MKCIPAHIIILFIWSLFMQSCIKDTIEECKTSSLLLLCRYTLNNQNTDLFDPEVRKMNVYVFDSQDKFVDVFNWSGQKAAGNYTMQIPLQEGTYRVVVVGGELSTYSVGELDTKTNLLKSELQKGTTSLKDFRMLLNNRERQDGYLEPQETPGELYVGHADKAVVLSTGSPVTVVELVKNTKKIKVKITGIDLLTRAIQQIPEIYITALNGRYKYEDSIDEAHKMFKYTPLNTSSTENEMEANLKTMRLVIGQAPMLTIKDPSSSEILYNKNMIEQILLHPNYSSQQDLDREDEFVFEINISKEGNDIVVSLLINGWVINHVVPVLNENE